MMGVRPVHQNALFYEFSLERHVPERHLLRSIDRFVELDGLRQELAPFYSEMGRPSVEKGRLDPTHTRNSVKKIICFKSLGVPWRIIEFTVMSAALSINIISKFFLCSATKPPQPDGQPNSACKMSA